MMVYDFTESLKAGERGEKFLDEFFSKKFAVAIVSPAEQRKGIDRRFTDKANGNSFTVEYKTDWKAGTTNNAFIETVSVDKENKPGWAYTSKANFILYFIPPLGLIYAIRAAWIKLQMPGWVRRFTEKTVPNDGYSTKGICVPLAEIERVAYKVINL